MPFLKGEETEKGTGGLGFLALSLRFGGSFSKTLLSYPFYFQTSGAKMSPNPFVCAFALVVASSLYNLFFLGGDFERLLRR